MGMGQWAWGMERIIFIRALLTAAFLIPNAHCPLPNAQSGKICLCLRSAKVSEILK